MRPDWRGYLSSRFTRANSPKASPVLGSGRRVYGMDAAGARSANRLAGRRCRAGRGDIPTKLWQKIARRARKRVAIRPPRRCRRIAVRPGYHSGLDLQRASIAQPGSEHRTLSDDAIVGYDFDQEKWTFGAPQQCLCGSRARAGMQRWLEDHYAQTLRRP